MSRQIGFCTLASWTMVALVFGVGPNGRDSVSEADAIAAKAAVERGQRFREERRWSEAIEAYDQALKHNPMSADAFAGRGVAWRAKGDRKKSLEDFDAAIRLDPGLAKAWSGRAETHRQLNDVKEAIADSTQAIALDPKYAAAYRIRGESYLAAGEIAQALADVDRALELDAKSAMAYFARGDIQRKLNRLDLAIGDYSQGIRLDPASPRPYFVRGELYRRVGKPELAIADFNHLIEIEPKKPAAYRGRGDAYLQLERYDLAVADYSAAISLDDRFSEAYAGRGEAFRRKGQDEQAIADLTKALEIDPSLKGVEEGLAVLRASRFHREVETGRARDEDKKDAERIVTALENRLRSSPKDENAEIWVSIGHTRGLLDQYAESLAAFDRALELVPDSANAHFGRGVTLHRLKHFEDSAAEFEFIVRRQRENIKAWVHLAIALGELGIREKERQIYERILARESNNPTALFNRGMMAYEVRELPDAIVSFERYVQERPDDPDGHANLAAALIDSEQANENVLKAGLLEAEKALALNGEHVVGGFNATLAHLLLGDRQKADEILLRVRASAPEEAAKLEGLRIVLDASQRSSAQEELAELARQVRTLRKAEEYARAILVANKAYMVAKQGIGGTALATLHALHDIAVVEIELGRYREAAKHLEECLREFDQSPAVADRVEYASILHDLARAELSLGNHDAAEKHARESLALREQSGGKGCPPQVETLALLTDVLITRGRRNDAAAVLGRWLEFVTVPGGPTEATVRNWHALGVSLYRMERLAEARTWLDRVAESARSVKQEVEALRCDVTLGSLDLKENRPQEALTRLLRATEALGQKLGKDHPETAAAHVLLGHAFRAAGRFDDAERALKQAIDVYQKHRSQPRGELQRAAFGERLGVDYATSELVATLVLQNRSAEALQAVENVRAGALQHKMGQVGIYVSPIGWKRMADDLGDGDVFLSIQWGPGAISALVLRSPRQALDVDGWILADDAGEVDDLSERAEAVARWVGVLPGSDTRRPDVNKLLLELGRDLFRDRPGASKQGLRDLLRNASRVIVVPDSPLAQVPFDLMLEGALQDSESRSAEKGIASGAIDVVYAPSANLFMFLDAVAKEQRTLKGLQMSMLLVGPPEAWPDSAGEEVAPDERGNHGVRDALTLSSYGFAKGIDNAEIRKLGEKKGYRITSLIGSLATREQFEKNLHGQHIVHVLAHGFSGSRKDPYHARIMFAPTGRKPDTGRDVLTLERVLNQWEGRLSDCRLMTLGACETQLAVPIGANAITLPWGCFYAGCPTVVATLWNVRQPAAYQIMNRFYENLLGVFDENRKAGVLTYEPGQGMKASHALAEAKAFVRRQRIPIEVVQEGEPEIYNDPYYWAGFVLIGEPD